MAEADREGETGVQRDAGGRTSLQPCRGVDAMVGQGQSSDNVVNVAPQDLQAGYSYACSNVGDCIVIVFHRV